MRVATMALQQTTAEAMQRAQRKLAGSQAQLSTGKKAPDLAALGADAVRTLSAHTLLARQEAQGAAATRLGTTLSLYDTNLTSMDDGGTALGLRLMDAIGTGEGSGLDEAISGAFDQFRSMLNTREGGLPLFGGGTDGDPFTATKIDDLVGTAVDTHFADGNAKARTRVADGLDVTYGVTASEVGKGMADVFRQLAEAGPFGANITAAQKETLKGIKAQLDGAMVQVRSINAENGRRQAQMEDLSVRADARALVLKDVIGRNEDADLSQIAIDLAQQKTVLQASYSVFAQLSDLSLLQYLR